jgi:hypothetical protein
VEQTIKPSFKRVYPDEFKNAETKMLLERQKRAGVIEDTPDAAAKGAVGLALSGGGIRSATFCLGVLQALARISGTRPSTAASSTTAQAGALLRQVDYLSTASGGGYVGGFLGRMFTRARAGATGAPGGSTVAAIESELADRASAPNHWLRENGRYLSPNGAGDILLAGSAYLRNLISVHVVLGTFVLALFLALGLIRLGLAHGLGQEATAWVGHALPASLAKGPMLWWSPWLAVPVVLMLFLAVPFGWAYWFTQHQAPRSIGAPEAAVAFAGLLGGLLTAAQRGGSPLPMFGLSVLLVLAPLLRALRLWYRFGGTLTAQAALATACVVGVGGIIAIAVAALSEQRASTLLEPYTRLLLALLASIALALAIWGVGSWVVRCQISNLPHAERQLDGNNEISRARNTLSAGLKWTILAVVVTAAIGVVDSLGQTIYAIAAAKGFVNTFTHPFVLPPVAALVALIASAQKIALWFEKVLPGGRLKLRWEVVASGVACLLLLAYMSVFSVIAHGFLWAWQTPSGNPASHLRAAQQESRASESEPAPSLTIGGSGTAVVTLLAPGATSAKPCAKPQETSSPGSFSIPRIPENPEGPRQPLVATFAFAVVALLSLLFGRTFSFITLSSHHPLYSARLTRAYLGASNPERQKGNDRASVTEVLPGDDIDICDYHPEHVGGPLHIVNVTLNETVLGRSNIEHRDRKGLSLAIGPAGVSVGVDNHATCETTTRPDRDVLASLLQASTKLLQQLHTGTPGPTSASEAARTRAPGSSPGKVPWIKPIPTEDGCNILGIDPNGHAVEGLSLGSWLGASGAAFTTGLGARTSLGLSLLLGLANVRIGRWWDAGVSPEDRAKAVAGQTLRGFGAWKWGRAFNAVLPVHSYLFDELLARFHGPFRRHWYLSDGGHFENTGCYELIRRRVPVIVVCDCGADPDYYFADIANLVRKARTDFGAEIEFVAPETIPGRGPKPDASRPQRVAPLDSVRPRPTKDGEVPASAQAHFALAKVTYSGAGTGEPYVGSVLLVLKPTLTGDEPEDVLHYSRTHTAFPQETTADQYFDEAQWESYRKLGEHIATAVLEETGISFDTLFDTLAALKKKPVQPSSSSG